MQVFLVEDSSLVRERLTRMLEALPGTEVVGHADSAEAAIHGILEAQPDLVLIDISLASGSGFDVLRAMQSEAPEIAAYMLSSFVAYPYRQLAETLGARGFFDKTHDMERVRELVAARAAEPQH
jgi:DNA-binding NarL/FixJ family response regulator